MKWVRTGRKIENKKNFIPIGSIPTRVRKFKNKCKKILKNKKYHPDFVSKRYRSEQAEKKRIKKILFLSVRTRPELENSKKMQKNSKNYKTSSGLYFKMKRV